MIRKSDPTRRLWLGDLRRLLYLRRRRDTLTVSERRELASLEKSRRAA